jgi:hypothetical protein
VSRQWEDLSECLRNSVVCSQLSPFIVFISAMRRPNSGP